MDDDDAGDIPIPADEGSATSDGAGDVPIDGEGTTWSQKGLGSIEGENTQLVREGEIRGEGTVDLPLSE